MQDAGLSGDAGLELGVSEEGVLRGCSGVWPRMSPGHGWDEAPAEWRALWT